MEYLIVGGSIAAAAGRAAIRRNQPEAKIRVVADEPLPFYYRPLIPYLLDGSKTAEEILLTEQAGAGTDADRIHDRCTAVNPAKRSISLASGRQLSYSKLLLAAGGAPLMLLDKLAGADRHGVFTLRSLDDAVKIRDYLPGCRTAAIIGGGLVGIKAAEALTRAGLRVTVLEQKEHILPLRADKTAAEAIAARLKQHGVTVLTKTSPQEITSTAGRAEGICLASGACVAADLVLVAVGIKPNIDFLADSGLAMDQAVLVDSRMRTSDLNIYAAGDLIQCTDQAAGRVEPSALWSNAVHTGRTAGCNMSGGRATAPPMLTIMNSTEIAGLPLISAGQLENAEHGCAVYADACGDNYRRLLFQDDRLVGMIFLGNIERAGVYVNMIRNQIPLQGQQEKLARKVMAAIC